MRTLLYCTACVATAFLAGCRGAPEQPATPTPITSQAVEASTPPVPPSTPRPRFDPSVPPGVLIIDYGTREGWDSGSPGAGRGAIVGLDTATGEELDWWQPVNAGHASFGYAAPGGRLVAFTGSYDFVLDVATGEQVELGGAAGGLNGVAWSADGRTFYGTTSGGIERLSDGENQSRYTRVTMIWEVDANTGESRLVAEVPFQLQAMRVDPGGGRLYLVAFRSEQCCGIEIEGVPFVAVIDLRTGEVAREIPLPDVVLGQRFEKRGAEGTEMNMLRMPGVALAPDGSRLYIAHADDERVTVVDLQAGEVVATVTPAPRRSAWRRFSAWASGLFVSKAKAKGGAYFTMEAAVSPDGRWLYVTGSGAEVCEDDRYFPCVEWAPMGLRIIDTATMELVARFDAIGHMAMTPDGSRLVGWGLAYDYRGDGETAREVPSGPFVIDLAERKVMGSVEPPVAGWQVVTSPDGRFAYTVTEGDTATGSALYVIDLERAEVVGQREYAALTVSLVGLAPAP